MRPRCTRGREDAASHVIVGKVEEWNLVLGCGELTGDEFLGFGMREGLPKPEVWALEGGQGRRSSSGGAYWGGQGSEATLSPLAVSGGSRRSDRWQRRGCRWGHEEDEDEEW
jgi:hypothetical protein